MLSAATHKTFTVTDVKFQAYMFSIASEPGNARWHRLLTTLGLPKLGINVLLSLVVLGVIPDQSISVCF